MNIQCPGSILSTPVHKKEMNIQTMMNYYLTIMCLIYKKKMVSSTASLL